ncbi:MAG: hypothetical protein Q4A47_04960 [Erysipelotrichaceae bacterium]|nr:hypothetical protein [Erysipelotrichaceae bacterium]
MSKDYIVDSSKINDIEKTINLIYENLELVSEKVEDTNNNTQIIYNDLEKLSNDFYEFVQMQLRANAKSNSQQRLIQIRQEIEKKFGHYDDIRRTAIGILQADDLGIVKRETITTVTEELMISTPGYWLAPCLVALAAWINDKQELAEKALREGIKRDDEKTSLFFALICRRANKKLAALKWTQRYLENQDAESIDRKTVIIIDAYASGLLGVDSEGYVTKQIKNWIKKLEEKDNYIENQSKQWSDSIKLKRKPFNDEEYVYLKKYSNTWSILEDIMEGAILNIDILDYFKSIFDKEVSNEPLKVRLDEILNGLVTDFDEEEVPLKKEERYNQYIVDFEGDVERAENYMEAEKNIFDERKDFSQILTDAAMNPEIAKTSMSTQKFAIALSKEWIINAYNDLTVENRMKIPSEIEINIESFNDKTTDGKNQEEIIKRFNDYIDEKLENELYEYEFTGLESMFLYGGLVLGIIGLITLNFAFILIGAVLFFYFNSKKRSKRIQYENIEDEYSEKRKKGIQIIVALLAEVVDFRIDFSEKDQVSKDVIDYLSEIQPEQYINKLAESNRRIKMEI